MDATLRCPPGRRAGNNLSGEKASPNLALIPNCLLSNPTCCCSNEPTNHLNAREGVQWLREQHLASYWCDLVCDRYFLDNVANGSWSSIVAAPTLWGNYSTYLEEEKSRAARGARYKDMASQTVDRVGRSGPGPRRARPSRRACGATRRWRPRRKDPQARPERRFRSRWAPRPSTTWWLKSTTSMRTTTGAY